MRVPNYNNFLKTLIVYSSKKEKRFVNDRTVTYSIYFNQLARELPTDHDLKSKPVLRQLVGYYSAIGTRHEGAKPQLNFEKDRIFFDTNMLDDLLEQGFVYSAKEFTGKGVEEVKLISLNYIKEVVDIEEARVKYDRNEIGKAKLDELVQKARKWRKKKKTKQKSDFKRPSVKKTSSQKIPEKEESSLEKTVEKTNQGVYRDTSCYFLNVLKVFVEHGNFSIKKGKPFSPEFLVKYEIMNVKQAYELLVQNGLENVWGEACYSLSFEEFNDHFVSSASTAAVKSMLETYCGLHQLSKKDGVYMLDISSLNRVVGDHKYYDDLEPRGDRVCISHSEHENLQPLKDIIIDLVKLTVSQETK